MNRKTSTKVTAKFDPFDLAGDYTELHIYGNQYYVVMWKPKHELRVVTGAFIIDHFDKCKVLSNPLASKRLTEESMLLYKERYIEFYNEKY